MQSTPTGPRFLLMPATEQALLESLDKILSGEIQLDDQTYRFIVLAELKAIRQQQIATTEKLDGNGHPGLLQRVGNLEGVIPTDLMDMVRWWRDNQARTKWLGQPLVVTFVLFLAGIFWALVTGKLHLSP